MRRHLAARVALDEPVILRLAANTLEGDKRSRDKLWLELRPPAVAVVRRCPVTRRLRDDENTRAEVASRVMIRLEADGFKHMLTFRGLLEHLDGRGSTWFGTLAYHVALRLTEQHPENLGPGVDKDRPCWVDVGSLPDERLENLLPAPARIVDTVFAHEVEALAESTLAPRQLDALRLRAEGYGNQEIAGKLGLPDAAAARRLVRAAQKRLRTRLGDELDGDLGEEGDEVEGDEKYIFRSR